jgi:glutamate racemase
LMNRFPHENIIYFGDTARVPYGPKSAQVVREYTAQDTDFLLSKNVKMIVIACNTVSSVAVDVVQKRAKIPVVGVILPGSESAVKSSKKKRIGVIGTLTTISSNAYANAIRQIDSSVEVFSQACPLFVPLAEEGWIEHSATELIANEYLFTIKLQKIDTLILGCTHYPILKNVIQKAVGESVQLIDSGESTVATVEHILDQEGLRNASTLKANVHFFVSDLPHKFLEIGELFLGQKMGIVKKVHIE